MASGQPTDRAYPGIEIFLETQNRSQVEERFAATKEALGTLPKLKAEHAKRALAAISQTEGLLHQLFDVKDKLSANVGKKTKR